MHDQQDIIEEHEQHKAIRCDILNRSQESSKCQRPKTIPFELCGKDAHTNEVWSIGKKKKKTATVRRSIFVRGRHRHHKAAPAAPAPAIPARQAAPRPERDTGPE